MANGGRIDFTVGYKLDKTGLNQIKTELQNLTKMSSQDFLKINPDIKSLKQAEKELNNIKGTVSQVQTAFDSSFNTQTGVVNVQRLSTSLKNLGVSNVYKQFAALGPQGVKAFNSITSQALKTNSAFRQTEGMLDKMGQTLTNTIKWGISSSIMNKFVGSVQQAYGYVQHLDTSLNDIRIVTGKSADEMDRFAEKANNAAKSLGQSTTAYTEAALIYYQQGLSDEEAQARAETTLKAANVTGQSGREVSEQLTAVWNGYKVTAEETEVYVDKLAAVAASTASDLEELSTGMSKVASAANNMGVDIDQLNAQLATIISVTRQAPETAGTALKTIYARMEDLKISGEDEDGVKLGEVSSTLEAVGISVMDTSGDLRDLGEVIEEVASKWDSWTSAQQNAIAQALAGKRQYNNLLALFDNWDMYTEALETSRNSLGTLQQQQDIYMESTAAHLQSLKTQAEDFYDSLIDSKDINNILDFFTKIVGGMTNFIDAIGGGKSALLGLGAVITGLFQKQFIKEIDNIGNRIYNSINQTQALKVEIQALNNMKVGPNEEVSESLKLQTEYKQQLLDVSKLLTNEEYNQFQQQIEEASKAAEELDIQKSIAKELQDQVQQYAKIQQLQTNNRTKKEINNANKAVNYNALAGTNQEAASKVLETQLQREQEILQAEEEYKKAVLELIKAREGYNKDLAEGLELTQEERDVMDELQSAATSLKNKLKLKLELSGTKESKALLRQLETTHKSVKEVGSASVQTEKRTNGLKKSIETLDTKTKKASSEAVQGLKKTSKGISEVSENVQSAQGKVDNFKQALNKSFDATKIRAFSRGILQLGQGMMSVSMGFQSLSSLGEILSDENLTFTQKLTQSLMSLSMVITGFMSGIPAVVSGTKELITNFSSLQGLFQLGGFHLLEYTKIIDKVAIGQKVLSTSSAEQIANYYKEIGLSETYTGQLTEEQLAEIADAAAKDGNAVATEVLTAANFKAILSTKGLKAALMSLDPTKLIIAGVTAAIIATVATMAVLDAQIKKTAKANKEAADRDLKNAKEKADKAKEEYDNVNKLVEAYKNLREELGDSNIEQLRRKIYDLSQEYGVHIDQLKLMSAGYEELDEMMEQLQQTAEENQYNANLEVIEAERRAIDAEMKQIEAESLHPLTQALEIFSPILIGLLSFFDSLKASLTELSADLQDVVHSFNDGLVTSLEKVATAIDRIVELLSKISPQINLIKEASDKITGKSVGENIVEGNRNIISSGLGVLGVFSGVNPVTESLSNASSSKSAKSSRQYFSRHESRIAAGGSTVEDMVSVDLQGNLQLDTEKWKNATDDQRAEIQDWYDKYYTQQGDFLGSIIKDTEAFQKQIFETDESITQYQTDLKNLQEDAAKKAFNQNIKTGVEDAYTYESAKQAIIEDLQKQSDVLMLTPEEIEELATKVLNEKADYDVQSASAITDKIINKTDIDESKRQELESQYAGMSTSEQNFISQNIDWLIDNDKIKEDLNQVKEEFDDLIEYENNKKNIVSIGVALTNSDGSEFKPEDIENMFNDANFDIGMSKEDFLAEPFEKQTAALIEYYTKLNQQQNKLAKNAKDQAKKIGKGFSEGFEKGMGKIDWSAYKKGVQSLQKATNSSIDDLQSAYSSLTSIMEEYNSTQTLSMDNLQTLLNMDTAYLSALQIENGQMTLNEDALKNIALAKLDEAEAEAYAQAMEELHNDETRRSIEMAGQASITIQQMGNIAMSAGQAAASGAAGWRQYWKAVLNQEGVADDAYSQQVGAALQTKLQAINAVRDQIKAGNFGTTMKGPSSAGAGSGSDSSKAEEADHEDYLEREADLYKTINEELDQIESTLSRIQTVADHKWGIDAQKALEKENQLLDKQLEKLEEKKALQQQDLSHRRGVLESIGIAFSEDGSAMLNSESVLDAMYANYNSMVDAYNNMSKAEQETYKAQLEAEQKRIEDIESKIDDYESGFSDYQDTLDKLLDAHYAQIENEVKLFNNMVDVHLELNDARKEWDKFWSEVVEDVQDNDFAGQIAASMKQLKTLVGLGGDVKESDVYTLTQHLMDTTTQVNAQIASANRGGEDSIFGDDTALSKETLQNYIQQLMDAVTAAKEALDNMAENYLKILDDAQDKIDKQIEGWESINDHLEHNLDLIKLISGEKAFDAIDNQLEKQYENNLNLLTTQKASQDFWAGEVKRYETLMASVDKNSKQYQTYEEAYNKSVENYRKAVSDLDKTVETSIKNLQDWRKNAVDNVMDTLDKAMSKGMGLDNMEKQWKLINDYASKYLDNVERALGMEEYTNVLDEAVNATGLTAANQEKLNQFREVELAQLNQKNKLTQFDLDESKARLEILKQQMALEDARNNKSNMRLRRDSQGNYIYQYTGDQEAEDQAENGLLTARREWYELVKARNKETRDDILAMEQQYQDNLRAMDEARLNNDIATLNALEEANKMLLEEIQFGYEQAEIAKRDLFQGTAQFFTDVEDAEILPMWEATIEEMVNEWSGDGEESFIGACTKAIQDLETVQDNYVTRTHQVLNTAGVDYNKLKEQGIDPTDESLKDLVMDNEDFATILEEVNGLLTEQEGYLRDAEAAYNDLEAAAISAITNAEAALRQLAETAIEQASIVQAAISSIEGAYSGLGGSYLGGNPTGNSPSGSPTTTSNNAADKLNVKAYREYGKDGYFYAWYGNKKYTCAAPDEATARDRLAAQIIADNPSLNEITLQYTNNQGAKTTLNRYELHRQRMANQYKSKGFATGGYTGDWDQGIPGTDNGRLAILHQKELVLNADDTSNMLKAVEVVRQLFSGNIISEIAKSLLNVGNSGLLGEVSSSLHNMGSHIENSSTANNSNITINADFSGVHDADEIYAAFMQLQNTALQSNFSTAPHLNISY